jgi:hypothetical protein
MLKCRVCFDRQSSSNLSAIALARLRCSHWHMILPSTPATAQRKPSCSIPSLLPTLAPCHPHRAAPNPTTTGNVDPSAPRPYYWHMSSRTASGLDSPTTHEVEMQHFNAAYIEAFDAGNAQALATLFTEDSLDPPTYRVSTTQRSSSARATCGR